MLTRAARCRQFEPKIFAQSAPGRTRSVAKKQVPRLKHFARPRIDAECRMFGPMHNASKFGAIVALAGTLVSRADEKGTPTAIEYALVDGTPLLLDLYRPSALQNGPLIVYVHGGA